MLQDVWRGHENGGAPLCCMARPSGASGPAGKKIEVVNYPDGRFAVRQEGIALPYRVFDKIQTVAPGTILENKPLGAALAFGWELQRRIRRPVGGAIHDASDHRTIWRHWACRQRAAHRAKF
jgi:hypothetical protein